MTIQLPSTVLARLMRDETARTDLAWLLHGPSDDDVVEPAEPRRPWLMAAE